MAVNIIFNWVFPVLWLAGAGWAILRMQAWHRASQAHWVAETREPAVLRADPAKVRQLERGIWKRGYHCTVSHPQENDLDDLTPLRRGKCPICPPKVRHKHKAPPAPVPDPVPDPVQDGWIEVPAFGMPTRWVRCGPVNTGTVNTVHYAFSLLEDLRDQRHAVHEKLKIMGDDLRFLGRPPNHDERKAIRFYLESAEALDRRIEALENRP